MNFIFRFGLPIGLVFTVVGLGGFGYVYFQQNSLPPGAARAEVWIKGITGNEGYSYAGLSHHILAGSDLFLCSLITLVIGVIMLALWSTSRKL